VSKPLLSLEFYEKIFNVSSQVLKLLWSSLMFAIIILDQLADTLHSSLVWLPSLELWSSIGFSCRTSCLKLENSLTVSSHYYYFVFLLVIDILNY